MDTFFITTAVIALLIFLVVSILVGVVNERNHREAVERFHYRPKKQLMTGAQKHCFQILNEIFGERFYIIPDVPLCSLLSHKVGSQSRAEAYSYIENKTADFVFCNKRTIRPVCAVKIDDSGDKEHSTSSSDLKDMEKFFRSAHLPFVRITNPKKLDRDTIINEFSRVIYETSLLDSLPKIPRGTKITHKTKNQTKNHA